jgi:hypothetical protein
LFWLFSLQYAFSLHFIIKKLFDTAIRSHNSLEENNEDVLLQKKDLVNSLPAAKNKIQFPRIYLKLPEKKVNNLNLASHWVQTEDNREINEPMTTGKKIAIL